MKTNPNWLDESAEAVLAEKASINAARMCEKTTLVDQDTVSLYGKACARGDGQGCSKLGVLYMCGASVGKSSTTAMTMFEKACALKEQSGCQVLAAGLLAGEFGTNEGGKRDVARAIRVYEQSCTMGGGAPSCGALGSMMLVLGKDESMRLGIKYLDKACVGGHGDSCGNLALAEAGGIGVPKNPHRGATIARESCEKNNAYSCGVLGMFLMNGLGVAEDEAGAAKLFAISCNAGESSGCASLATCHYRGLGVHQDTQKAADLYRKACDSGSGQACRQLAEMGIAPPVARRTTTVGPTTF